MAPSLKNISYFIYVLKIIVISVHSKDMVRIIYPGIDSYYLKTIQSTAEDTNGKFWQMSKEIRKQLCIDSFQSYSFQVVDNENTILEPLNINRRAAIQEINKYYETSIPNVVKYHSVAAVVKNLILAVNAHLCRLTPEVKSFLTQGDAPGTFLALERSRGPFFKIQGLLELVPEVILARRSENRHAIDNDFIRRLNENNNSRTVQESVCEINDAQRIRLCSTVYIAYEQNRGRNPNRRNPLKSENSCLKKVHIDLEPEEGLKEVVQMDLIPCFVGEQLNQSKPSFYLTNDLDSSNRVYLVQEVEVDQSTEKDDLNSSGRKFSLELHLQRVTQLEELL